MTFLAFHATRMLHTAQGPQLFDIGFELEQGRTLAIYGPSGAGKTTLLRILAGLTPAASGHIRIGDETWLDTGRHIDLPTRHRSIGFVFQDFALFPNLTVRKQLEYALPGPAPSPETAKDQRLFVDELLALMELEALQHRRPALLSGGQQQRVAIARAIARRPRLLLLDEPLSALDDEIRHKLQEELLTVQRHYHLTTLLVSHQLPEIFRLAHEVIQLEQGRIKRQGSPENVFAQHTRASVNISGTILDLTSSGETVLVRVDCGGAIIPLTLSTAEAETLRPGQTITVSSTLLHPRLSSNRGA
jgi:molybdate transport system ATP-binding protein